MIKVKVGDWVLIRRSRTDLNSAPLHNSRVARVREVLPNAIRSIFEPPIDKIWLNTDLMSNGCGADWVERKLTELEVEQYKTFCVEARDLTNRIQAFFGGEVKFVDPQEFEVNT